MTARQPSYECYELKGASLTAARHLERLVAEAVNAEQPQNRGNLAEIQRGWQAFYRRLLARLAKEDPAVLKAAGLLTPSTVVQAGDAEFARAYHELPAIFSSPERPARYFMYVPCDHYKADFVPQDARLLSPQEKAQVDVLLFAGGWLGNAPMFSLPRHGVKTPDDIVVAPDLLAFAKNEKGGVSAFIAAGPALEIVKRYEADLRDYRDKLGKAFDALKKAAENLFPRVLRDLPEGEGVYVNLSGASSLIDGADTCITISLHRKGSGGTFLQAGQSVAIPDNPYFKTVPRHGDHAVMTRDDTAEGRALAKTLLAVPEKRPLLSDHCALTMNGNAPMLVTLGHYKVLRYLGQNVETSVPPYGAVPFPPAALAWLRADEDDRRKGDTPPPMPELLVRYLSQPHSRSADSKPANKAGRVNPTK